MLHDPSARQIAPLTLIHRVGVFKFWSRKGKDLESRFTFLASPLNPNPNLNLNPIPLQSIAHLVQLHFAAEDPVDADGVGQDNRQTD